MNPVTAIQSRKNRYAVRAKVTERKLREMVRLFARHVEASHIAEEIEVSRGTVNEYLRKIRMLLARRSVLEAARQVDGQGTRGVFSVHPVSRSRINDAELPVDVMRGVVQTDRRVTAEVMPGQDREVLKALRKGRMAVRGWEHDGCMRRLCLSVDLRCQVLDQNEIVQRLSLEEVGSAESIRLFLAYLQIRLAKLRGVPLDTFHLHLKECEYRFNVAVQGGSLSRRILALLRENPLQ